MSNLFQLQTLRDKHLSLSCNQQGRRLLCVEEDVGEVTRRKRGSTMRRFIFAHMPFYPCPRPPAHSGCSRKSSPGSGKYAFLPGACDTKDIALRHLRKKPYREFESLVQNFPVLQPNIGKIFFKWLQIRKVGVSGSNTLGIFITGSGRTSPKRSQTTRLQ